MQLQFQHACAGHDHREDHRNAARSLLPGAHLQAVGHGGYFVRLGFQIASNNPEYSGYRSPGSMSWAGIYNTEFWIDPVKHIGGVQMMQVLPFYDDGAIKTLRGFEELVY